MRVISSLVLFLPLSLALIGCPKEGKPSSDSAGLPAVLPLIKTAGCGVSKAHGTITVLCTDGSSVDFSEPVVSPPAPPIGLMVKDASSVKYTNLIHLDTTGGTGHILFNTVSKNILSYNPQGNMGFVDTTYYETTNCTGYAFAYFSTGGLYVKNRVALNVNAWPTSGVTAFRVVDYSAASVAMRSKFLAGVCSTVNFTINQMPVVEPTTLDVTDLLTLDLPIELVTE